MVSLPSSPSVMCFTPILLVILGLGSIIIVAILNRRFRLLHSKMAKFWTMVLLAMIAFIVTFAILIRSQSDFDIYLSLEHLLPFHDQCYSEYQNGGGSECDERMQAAFQAAMDEAHNRFGMRYWLWSMLPPVLRPPCQSIDAEVCQIEAVSFYSANSKYLVNWLFSLIPMVGSLLAIRWYFIRQHKKLMFNLNK